MNHMQKVYCEMVIIIIIVFISVMFPKDLSHAHSHTHKNALTSIRLNTSVLAGIRGLPITEWGLLGSAGSDLIGHRCCCCGDELCRRAQGYETVGPFPDWMQHGMRWSYWCLTGRMDRWRPCQLWRVWARVWMWEQGCEETLIQW